MASEQMLQMAEVMRTQQFAADETTLEQRREGMEAFMGSFPVADDVVVEDLVMAGVPCRWTFVPESRASKIILYLHGGGYVLGSLNSHQELMARLARKCKARVMGVDYRLAPENPFPSGLEDAFAAFRALQRGSGGASIAIAGDSAGGGLALATMLKLRDANLPLPAAAVLFSPWTDLTGSGESFVTRADLDPMIKGEAVLEMGKLYAGGRPLDKPLISPVFADLSNLSPMLIQVGDHEVLLDDSTRVAKQVTHAGGEATLQTWEQAFHVFQAMPQIPEAEEALDAAAEFLESKW